jgi:hypothetical protein
MTSFLFPPHCKQHIQGAAGNPVLDDVLGQLSMLPTPFGGAAKPTCCCIGYACQCKPADGGRMQHARCAARITSASTTRIGCWLGGPSWRRSRPSRRRCSALALDRGFALGGGRFGVVGTFEAVDTYSAFLVSARHAVWARACM